MRAEQVDRVENTFVLSVDGAFDVLPSHGTIQNGYLRGLVDLVRSRGCDPRKKSPLMCGTGTIQRPLPGMPMAWCLRNPVR